MNINFKGTDTVLNVINQFRSSYPYLKIEFYNQPHERNSGSKPEYMVGHDVVINQLTNHSGEISIAIPPDLKTFELEEIFEKNLNLHIQVFRKNGDIWLQTTRTDDWSLKQQNEEGDFSVHGYGKEEKYPDQDAIDRDKLD